MSRRIPSLTPRETCAALERIGFRLFRQRGSHRIYVKGDLQVVIPFHSRELKKGTLHQIIKGSGVTTEEFLKHI